jgi:hypothetical protein
VDTTIEAMVTNNVLPGDIRDRIVDATLFDGAYDRPTPTIDRDVALEVIQPYLIRHDVYSRGLSGSWVHEAGDLDHSFLQGVECADYILHGTPERIWPAPASRTAEASR